MPRDRPLERSLRRPTRMETIELMVVHAEHHNLTVLRTACRIGPNAAEATVKADYSKIGARRRCYTEADSQ